MNYYLAVFICFLIGFFVTELVKHLRNKRVVVVSVKHRDGSVSTVLVRTGRDPEVDALIKQAQNQKERAV